MLSEHKEKAREGLGDVSEGMGRSGARRGWIRERECLGGVVAAREEKEIGVYRGTAFKV
jgi:hypothetical protein